MSIVAEVGGVGGVGEGGENGENETLGPIWFRFRGRRLIALRIISLWLIAALIQN